MKTLAASVLALLALFSSPALACVGMSPDALPAGVAPTQDLAQCLRYTQTMRVIARSATGDMGNASITWFRNQKAYFEGYCRNHPEAAAYVRNAEMNIRNAEAYVPTDWERELRAAHAASQANDLSGAARHEAAALRLLPASLTPHDVANVYAQIGCLRGSRDDIAGTLSAYRDGLARIGDAQLVDRTQQVEMLFRGSALLVQIGRENEALDFAQRAGEAYLASQMRTITQGTQLQGLLAILAIRRPDPLLDLARKVREAMTQHTGPFVDRPPVADNRAPAQEEAEVQRTFGQLGEMQRDTADRNIAEARAKVAAAEARLRGGDAGARPALEADVHRERTVLAAQLLSAGYFAYGFKNPERARVLLNEGLRAWALLRLADDTSTLGRHQERYALSPPGPAAVDAFMTMARAFATVSANGRRSANDGVFRNDAIILTDAAWALSQ
ncbi:MAG: hypothetical protein SGJ23_16135 [Alphaproteobacteria bacterium]|nr:hypothetical protein [Alphaproteobacteria bacterium]